MAEAPLGIPTAQDCVDAARDTAALLEQLGHEVVEVEVPTISAELVPAFTTMAAAGLAAYDGVDWEKVEPHNRHSHEVATKEISAYDYVVAAQTLERLSRREVARWGRDFDVLLTPTSAILPPEAGSVLAAQPMALQQECLLAGGDDYELVFTMPAGAVLPDVGVPLTRIGVIEAEPGLRVVDAHGAAVEHGLRSFDHFAS